MSIYRPTVRPRGPEKCEFLIVGEAPGSNEEQAGVPFVGSSGKELEKMLTEAGINPGLCRYTNVINIRPPDNKIDIFFRSSKKAALADGAVWFKGKWCMPEVLEAVAELHNEIERCQPACIIPVGNVALWALTDYWGITKWRGSQLRLANGTKILPTYHPAAVLRQWELRWITVVDLKRAKKWAHPDTREPDWQFILRPGLRTVIQTLAKIDALNVPVAVDIETRNKQIACIGLAWSATEAICIPILCIENAAGYWSLEEEVLIYRAVSMLMRKKQCIGQNFLYDMQYFAKQLGLRLDGWDDTMLAHHVCFPGTPKGLDFISSLYNDFHRYWKDEGKTWDRNTGEEQLWNYNCLDACATWEAHHRIAKVVEAFKLTEQYALHKAQSQTAFRMMLRGARVDLEYKRAFTKELEKAIEELYSFLHFTLGRPVNVQSPKQMHKLCYDVLQLPPKYKKTKDGRRLTCDATAIEEWCVSCEPLFRPLLQAILDIRSLAVFKATFGEAGVDWDGRVRCSYNVAGPETFRWSSSEDAFGYGMNLQTISSGDG
ncbi:MAG: hypothetical protein E6R03_03080 [Hyphomicrobiaceae bacterium]|nr:MAG: hypothetical protein E6R03_03080 [Hyphomicrobiaceae bacterium]